MITEKKVLFQGMRGGSESFSRLETGGIKISLDFEGWQKTFKHDFPPGSVLKRLNPSIFLEYKVFFSSDRNGKH